MMSTGNNSEGELKDRIKAMIDKESSTYLGTYCTRLNLGKSIAYYAESRRRMVKWILKFTRHCNWMSGVSFLAISNLDRFINTKQGFDMLYDERLFQLATVSSLSIAAKILETTDLDLEIMVQLSNRLYSAQDIIQMENIILNSLKWILNPPTSFSFIEHFIELLHIKCPNSISMEQQQQIKKMSLLQAEAAANDLYFCQIKPSIIATASIINSIKSFDYQADAQQMFSELIFDFGRSNKKLNLVQKNLTQHLKNQQHSTKGIESPNGDRSSN